MGYKYLVMELIGQDLDQLKKRVNNQRFSLKTVLMVGLQIIDRLEALHKIGFIHRDVKPDNLAIGLKQRDKIIYLFDFGLSLPIGAEIPKEEKGKVIGTLGFMSCRSHEGKIQGPADDLESLIYTLIYLLEGTLPWLKLQIRSPADFHKILSMKKNLTNLKGSSVPRQFIEILQLLRDTKPKQKIDYLHLKYKLLEVMKRIKESNDFVFDWCQKQKMKPPSPLKKSKTDSPEDSPRRNFKIQQMNEENQRIVQNQIYQVYKFMDHNQPKRQKSPSPPRKRSESKPLKPPKQLAVRPLKRQEQQKKKNMRPISAANKPKKKQQSGSLMNILKQFGSLNVSGPKIVINKTAKHKI